MAYDLRESALSHLRWHVTHASMRGRNARENSLWMSSLNLASGQPLGPERPEGIAKRCYRFIESPWGSNLYWDVPLLAASHLASGCSGDPLFADAADAYARDYIALCTSASGLFWWGNHYYYDSLKGSPVFFSGDGTEPQAVQPSDCCHYHETRPLRVPWELLWRVNPGAVEKSIRAQAMMHIVDPATGEFNRHADNKAEHPFQEAGGILAESLCWLGVQVCDENLVDLAEMVLRFNFNAAHASTGLMPVSPRKIRWDFHTATSETGLWAGCALRCHALTGRPAFQEMAAIAMAVWLDHAWDADAMMFLGRLDVTTGKADRTPRSTPYQPCEYCDPWEPLFPAHDYPIQAAETCLRLFQETGRPAFRDGTEHWLRHFEKTLPARCGKGGYAEHYGRMLHWLTGVETAGWKAAAPLRERLYAEIRQYLLFDNRLLRSHPGEDRCDAVDGMGFLLWALLEAGTVENRSWEPW